MAAPDAHIFPNLINQFAQDHDDLNDVDQQAHHNLINQFARRNLLNQFARQQFAWEHDVDDEARRNLINQFARQHDVDLYIDHEARRNLLNHLYIDHEARRNLLNQFAPEHNIEHQALRNLGLFLVFVGASIILGAMPQQLSDIISKDIFMAFTAFVLGILLISLSLVVNYYNVIPRAAAFVDAVLNHSLVVIAICLSLIHL